MTKHGKAIIAGTVLGSILVIDKLRAKPKDLTAKIQQAKIRKKFDDTGIVIADEIKFLTPTQKEVVDVGSCIQELRSFGFSEEEAQRLCQEKTFRESGVV